MLAEEFEALQGLRSGGALGLSKFRLLTRPLAPFPTCPLTVRFAIGCFLLLFSVSPEIAQALRFKMKSAILCNFSVGRSILSKASRAEL